MVEMMTWQALSARPHLRSLLQLIGRGAHRNAADQGLTLVNLWAQRKHFSGICWVLSVGFSYENGSG
jgi:hypothetical protein